MAAGFVCFERGRSARAAPARLGGRHLLAWARQRICQSPATRRQNRRMAVVALAVIALWMLLVATARTYLHLRAGGGRPVRFADRPGTPQRWARAIGSIAFVLLMLAPIAELLGLPPLDILGQPLVRLGGVVVALAGIAGTVAAQAAMGASWRGDVDPEARTALVTSGPFRWVRNPIFTANAVASLGVALDTSHIVTI